MKIVETSTIMVKQKEKCTTSTIKEHLILPLLRLFDDDINKKNY